MAVQLQRDFYEHEAPTIPHVEWRSAIVRYTRGSASDIRLFPDETRGQVLAQVYRGDMIQICLTYEKDNWRVCRCGHITGWIDTNTVKLLMRDLYDPASEEPRNLSNRFGNPNLLTLPALHALPPLPRISQLLNGGHWFNGSSVSLTRNRSNLLAFALIHFL